MDTNFNAALYQEEMLSLVNTAIKKLKAEHPDYTVFTISLTTDFASGVSAVHFDSRASSERYLKNEAEQYQKYLQAGNLSMAEMYAPTGEIRITNPADFELPFYAEIQNESFSLNFEEEQEDEDSELEDEASCVYWEEATPILKQVAAVAYRTAKSELNVDTEAFEVSYNGPEDWYYPVSYTHLVSAKRLLRRLWRSWSMPLLPHCGPSWSRANGWAAILCRMPARIVYRSRLPQSS